MKKIYTILFLLFFVCILSHSRLSLSYAFMGLMLWFENMIPALLPFMILSGIMIRMNLTGSISQMLYPIVRPLYRVSENGCYAMMIGFLCGFPMGAKTIADLLKRNKISFREAEFLLSFCNNIGPVYFCSFVLPLLGRQLTWPYVFGMYGIPLLYGFLLRRIGYGHWNSVTETENHPSNTADATLKLLNEIDDAINSSVQSILSLGGYMILFNVINLIPHILLRQTPLAVAPFLEITGGLKMADGRFPLYFLLLLPFGGLSCLAQSYHCIQGTGLSLTKYLFHKMLLTALTALYYLGWYISSPMSFMR